MSLVILLYLAVASAWADETLTLTNASQIRNLTTTAAAQRLPIQLNGIVIGEALPAGKGFAIQDGTGGIYVEAKEETVAQLKPGDLVEIKGVSDPGSFAPFVVAREVHKTGKGELPEPRQVTYAEMSSGKLDAQWVELRGVVRYCEPSANDPRKYRLEMATGGGRLVVRWNVSSIEAPLVDAEVRLRGVCYYLVNQNRQLLSPMLAIPHDVPVVIEKPPPADPFSAPARPVSSLMQFAPDSSYGHRVHVRGVVIRRQEGEALWIRDGGRGLHAVTPQPGALRPGEEVDVLGFPTQDEYSPMLEDAVFQKTITPVCLPAPIALPNTPQAFYHDADLVELDASLVNLQPVAGGWAFALNAMGGTKVNALLRTPNGRAAPTLALPGSRVRVVGVCSVFREYSGFISGLSHPQAFQLLLRSASDLSVLEPPPWWTLQRITWLLTAAAGISLMAAAGVFVAARLRLREQVANRTRAEAEFSAILGERNRVARELHDILAQGLSAIVLHLDLAKDDFARLPRRAANHLEIALGLARSSTADAGNAVWNLRSQALEKNDLPAALECVLQQLTEGSGVGARFELTGHPRRLPPATENAILRIGQEAITNATKHGRAKHIEVKLNFAERIVNLSVTDDGLGFNADQPPSRPGRFGLVGLRERAAQLGGALQIGSKPGRGTEINLAVPVAS